MTTAAMPSPGIGRPAIDTPRTRSALHVDTVDGGLLLRTPDDPTAALRLLTRVVAAAHTDQSTVVCAGSVSRRPDLFELLAQRLGQLRPAPGGVRLVLLGRGPDRETRERGYRELAQRVDRVVVGPTGPVMVASDGGCAVADAAGGWLRCDRDGTVTAQPPWSPAPPWSALLTLGAPLADGRIGAHPVPAGVWLLPQGIAPDRAGVVPNLPRDRAGVLVFVGGGAPPLDAGDVDAAVTALGLPPEARVVLLPGGLRLGPLPSTLARWVRGAVPALSPAGWRLVAVTPDGTVAPDTTEHYPEWTAPGPADRPKSLADSAPAGCAELLADSAPASCAELAMPPGAVAWVGPPPGRRTPAGWSFVDGPTVGFTPAAAGPVVEVAPAADGFAVADRTLTAAEFAGLLHATVAPGMGGVVLIGGPYPVSTLTALGEALDAPITVATGPVVLTADGAVRTSGTFQVWRGAGPPHEVGPVIPAAPAGPDPDTLTQTMVAAGAAFAAARAAAATDAPPPKRWGWRRRRAPEPSPAPPAPPAADPVDLTRLTHALPDTYRQHLAHVAAVLNSDDSPVPAHRLIDEEERERVTAGLVAVRAYWGEHRTTVDRWLRGGSDPYGHARALVEWARIGLDQLPAVTGPLFAAVAESHPYQPGTAVVEPGFVEAGLAPAAFPTDGLDYVIWSTTARRLGRVIHGGEPTALFPPGTRFAVLDVEWIDRRCRVFLAETGPAATPPADVLDRLRAAAAAPASAPVVSTGAPIGS